MKKFTSIFRLSFIICISGSMLACFAGKKHKKSLRINTSNIRLNQQKLIQDRLAQIPLDQSEAESFKRFLKWTNEKNKIKKQLIKVISQKFKLDERIEAFDIGAGDGTLTQFLGGFFNHITALEPNPDLWEKITERCNHITYELLKDRFEDFSQNPKIFSSYEGKIDFILISHAFKFISNQEREILNIKKLLNKKGVLLIFDNNQQTNEFVHFYNDYGPYFWSEGRNSPKPPDYPALLKKSFNVQTKTFSSNFEAPSVEDMLSICNFVFDKDLREMKEKDLLNVYYSLLKKYGVDPIKFNTTQDMYICTPK